MHTRSQDRARRQAQARQRTGACCHCQANSADPGRFTATGDTPCRGVIPAGKPGYTCRRGSVPGGGL